MSNLSPDNFGIGEASSPLISEYADDADMCDLVQFFVSELQERIRTLETALQTNDERRLREMAHQLKGAAACYGFPEITESAAVLEHALLAEEAELSALSEKVEVLIGLCRRAAAGGE